MADSRSTVTFGDWSAPPVTAGDDVPYVYQEYPRALYNKDGELCIVGSKAEEDAKGSLWAHSQADAIQRARQWAEDIGTAAAMRAYDDRRLSEAAKEEALNKERAVFEHVADIPAEPIKRRGRPVKVKDVTT